MGGLAAVQLWRRLGRGLTFGMGLGLCLLAAAGTPAAADRSPVLSPTEAWATTGENARVPSGREFFGDAPYSGSDSCKSCHATQYQSWRASWHSKMERWPAPDTVLGDFRQRRMQLRNLRVRSADGKEARISPTALAYSEGGRYYFTLIDQDNSAQNQTFEVAKVLGGKWDQGYEIRLGKDNYLPAPIRWSVLQNDWIVGGFNPQDWFVADGTPDGRPLTAAELPRGRVAEAKCNGCHTTGYRYAKGDDGVWKARMHGQGEIGVACESCHGPASRHVDEAHAAKAAGRTLVAGRTAIVNPLRDLNAEQATQVCGQCHGRGTHKQEPALAFPTGFLPGDTDLLSRFRLWSFSGTNNADEAAYFWRNDWAARNRQQYQDFTRSGHHAKGGMSCLSCHALHGSTVPAQLRQPPEKLCIDCHRADGVAMRPNAEMFAGSAKEQAGMTCVDCHMPRIGSRSRATASAGHQWDATSHVFAVATPLLEQTLGVRSACVSCHDDAQARSPGQPSVQQQLIDDMRRQAGEVLRGITGTQALLVRADLRRPGVETLVLQARSRLEFVRADNSKGAHNIGRTRQLLREANEFAALALALPQR